MDADSVERLSASIPITEEAVLIRRAIQASTLMAAGIMAAVAVAVPAHAQSSNGVDQSLLKSKLPKTVVLDVKTGAIVSVSSGITQEPGTYISTDNICQSSDACYYSGKIPYADQGFFGTNGTISGSWPYRSGGYTGAY